MSIDVVDLRDFYSNRLGAVARHFVGRGVRRRWIDTRGLRVLGIGYATPYLGLFREEAKTLSSRIRAAAGSGNRDAVTRAHLIDSAGTLDEALKAPLVRQGV